MIYDAIARRNNHYIIDNCFFNTQNREHKYEINSNLSPTKHLFQAVNAIVISYPFFPTKNKTQIEILLPSKILLHRKNT